MMKTLLIAICLLFVSLGINAQQRLVLEGHYQGKNLFVQNPFKDVGFCVEKVTVNGDVTSDEINSSAFEIDFTKLGLTRGQSVSVVIEHGSECTPKVLNPEILKPQSACKYESINLTPDGHLTWTTSGETGKLPFIVEIYNWNKWIPVGEVDGEGTPGTHDYDFQITMHSGTVKARVKQIDFTKKPNHSQPATAESPVEKVAFGPIKVSKKIEFMTEKDEKPVKTRYEIYDAYGNLVKKGYGESIDCSNLSKGAYYLNYDATNDKFLKK